jgi:3-isopropylmalate/(R)-2-methylmalate dehydratase small subunit
MSVVVKGRVWKFGDQVNTDYMAPGFTFQMEWEEARQHILHIHDRFASEVRPGDVIVAGRNFGCGSSRENAPANLKRLGIGCVVAESFGRIFYRNCIAIALPAMACPGVAAAFEEGQQLEFDMAAARVTNLTTGVSLSGPPMSEDLVRIIEQGGILPLLRARAGKPAAPGNAR